MLQSKIQLADNRIWQKNPADLIMAGLGVVSVAVIGGAVTMQSLATGWYQQLNFPAFQPPNWLFGSVWTVLYVLMLCSYAIVRWKAKASDIDYQAIFGVNLLVNLAWTLIFFGFQSIAGGAVVLAAYILICAGTALIFARYSRLGALLQLPLILWVAFALILNSNIYLLNKF